MFRIAGIRVEKTQGYNPHPKLRFALPLATGFQSENELLEVFLETEFDDDGLISAINSISPQGLEILAVTRVSDTFPKITAVVDALGYRVNFSVNSVVPKVSFDDLINTKKGEVRVVDNLISIKLDNNQLSLIIKVENQKTLRPDDLVRHMYPDIGLENILITRTGIYSRPDERLNPLPAGLELI